MVVSSVVFGSAVDEDGSLDDVSSGDSDPGGSVVVGLVDGGSVAKCNSKHSNNGNTAAHQFLLWLWL